MTYQNRAIFPYDLQHFGCCLFAICFHLYKRFIGLDFFTDTAMLQVYNNQEINHDLGIESTVVNPQGLCDNLLESRKVLYRLDGPDPENPQVFPPDHVCAANDLEVQCWFNKSTLFHHFVSAEAGVVVYDPIEGGSLTLRQGKIESKRIFTILTQ